MLNYIHLYPNPHEQEFNLDFIQNTQDTPIEDYIINAMREFERISNIEIIDVRVVKDQDEVDINYHSTNINYKKKDLESIQIPKNKSIYDSRYGEVRFKIRITTNLNERVIEKRILMPMMDDTGLYVNNGKKMKAIKQLVDASIYSQRGKITLKAKMPIIIYCNKNRPIIDVDDNEHLVPSFSYALEPSKGKGRKGAMGKKKVKFVNPVMIYSAKMGFTRTVDFFGMRDIVEIVGEYTEEMKEENYIFPVNELFVVVNKHMFDTYELVRSFTCMCCGLRSKGFPLAIRDLDDKNYWIARIGFIGSVKNNNELKSFYEKGLTMLYMIEQLLNYTTINNLRLPMVYKQNIYYLMYWMITNFDALKARNNIDMKNKRVRVNEYIVDSSLGKKINENINKFIETKSKSRMNTIDTLLELFNFGSDIIVSNMRNLNDLLKSDELVNDLTFLQDLAYSAKGPQSLGEGSPNAIADKYRYLHESMVGVIDLFATSNSNYGLSGYFSPFVKTYNRFYFTPETEPCDARYLFDKALAEEERWIPEYDISSFDNYVADIENKKSYDLELQYEKLVIVEKEEDTTDYSY